MSSPDKSVTLTAAEAREIIRRAPQVVHLIAVSDSKPYIDDPRWSPWSWGSPLAERCTRARETLAAATSRNEVSS